MAFAGVGAAQATSGSTNLSLSRTAATIGNLLVVAFGISSTTAVPTIADTQTNTWLPVNPVFHDTTNGATVISWCALAKNTTSTTVTVTGNGGGVFVSMTLEEFSGNDQVSPVDQAVHSAVGASGTPTSPSFTPAVGDELAWAYASDTVTAVGNIDGSAATKGGDDANGDWSEYRILVGRAGVAMTAAVTGSGAYTMLAATFKPLAAGTVVPRPSGRPFPFKPGSPPSRNPPYR